MTKEQALNLMRSSETVDEWNENREIVQNLFEGTPAELTVFLAAEIDGSGLINEVLKPNKQNEKE